MFMLSTAVAMAQLLAFSFVTTASAESLQLPEETLMILKKLQLLVQSTEEPKGTPFPPLIAKPGPSQRIAIVGAGLSGLHMAYLLHKKGFSNIVVLEKDSRVGGKIMSIWHDGVPHEMGACYMTPDYTTNVYALAKELAVDKFVSLPTGVAWLDNVPFPLPFKSYVVLEIKRLTNAKDNLEAVGNLVDATYRYSVLHRQMFGKYEGDLMYKPSSQVLSQLNQTFMSFLKQHDLLALVPIFFLTHTLQGYGHLDRVPSLYGMLWETPNLLYATLLRSVGVTAGGIKMFRNGFQQLTDKLASFSDIRLNVAIENIKRDSTGVTIKFNDGQDNTERFDFLIWAADAREALLVLEDTTPFEQELCRLKNTWFTTTLFEFAAKEVCPTDASRECWVSNIYLKRENSVWAQRHSKYVIEGGNCTSNIGKNLKESMVSYQMGIESPLQKCMVKKTFFQHYQNERNVKIINSQTWNYFPRYSLRQTAEGILWKIVENQGDRNTWFTGSAVIFESAKSVIEYNKLMLRRMEIETS